MKLKVIVPFLFFVHFAIAQEKDLLLLSNCFPTKEEVLKFKIKELVLQSSLYPTRDTIRFNNKTGLIEGEYHYYKRTENLWTLDEQVQNYYTNTILDSTITTKLQWWPGEKGYYLDHKSSSIIQYDSLKRIVLENYWQYHYIQAGNVTYKIRHDLRWKKETKYYNDNGSYKDDKDLSSLQLYGVDTTKWFYDTENRMIRCEYPNNSYKTFTYEPNTITVSEFQRSYEEKRV